MSVTMSALKWCSVCYYYQWFVWMLMFYCFFCVCLRIVMSNILSYPMSFTFWFPCSDARFDFCIKRCLVRLYLQLFVGELMSSLRYLCLFAHSGVEHILTIWVAWRVSQKRKELFTLLGRLDPPPVFGGSVLLIFFVFCVVFFALFVFVLCLVYLLLLVSLNCPFLIAPSVFSNVKLVKSD